MKEYIDLNSITLQLKSLKVLRALSQSYSHLGEDYLLSHITASTPRLEERISRRFDGLTVIISLHGQLKITIDQEQFEVPPYSMVFIPPETVFQPVEWTGAEREVYVLFMSLRFINDINFDLNAIDSSVFATPGPVLELSKDKIDLLVRYFDLLHITASTPAHYSRHIARSLTAAAGYLLMGYTEEHARNLKALQPNSRKLVYARNFMTLVKEHHRTERAIAFYADKMFISAKYLSLIIKETTGRSAAEWIDFYVLQDAKNMLRYSGKNVQQIAYELNFNNQSSFGKYFKHLTGLSPTQFQNS